MSALRSPWPSEIIGFGNRSIGPFSRCAKCGEGVDIATAGTWAYYGGFALCLAHALEILGEVESAAAEVAEGPVPVARAG
jgi:hypothetical protein